MLLFSLKLAPRCETQRGAMGSGDENHWLAGHRSAGAGATHGALLGSQERGDQVLHSEGPLQAVPSAMTLRTLGLCGLHDETQTALLSTSTFLGP